MAGAGEATGALTKRVTPLIDSTVYQLFTELFRGPYRTETKTSRRFAEVSTRRVGICINLR